MSINSRIVNGRPASIDQFPWFASVRSHTEHGQQSICGGSIISTEWVLTAAHCTRGFDSFTLGFGSNLLNSPMITMHTRHVIEHIKYNPKLLNYDIALIKLPNPLQYTVKIQAIRLPTVSQAFTRSSLKYAKARVCGYGRTTDGRYFGKKVVNNFFIVWYTWRMCIFCHRKTQRWSTSSKKVI